MWYLFCRWHIAILVAPDTYRINIIPCKWWMGHNKQAGAAYMHTYVYVYLRESVFFLFFKKSLIQCCAASLGCYRDSAVWPLPGWHHLHLHRRHSAGCQPFHTAHNLHRGGGFMCVCLDWLSVELETQLTEETIYCQTNTFYRSQTRE